MCIVNNPLSTIQLEYVDMTSEVSTRSQSYYNPNFDSNQDTDEVSWPNFISKMIK